MKKIILALLISAIAHTQQVVGIGTGHMIQDMPRGSYIKDINGDFNKFIGIWVWTNGLETVTFKLQKVIHHLDTTCGSYEDYMIGDYKYTTDNENTTVVNTFVQGYDNQNSQNHAMYACCPDDNHIKIDFVFRDIKLQKKGCSAIFEFLPGSTTQMKVTLKNRDGWVGTLTDDPNSQSPPSPDFTLPNNIVVTKQ